MALTPELVYLKPAPGPLPALVPKQAGLALNFQGGGNFFTYDADVPMRLQQQISLPKPFVANTVNFLVGVLLANSGGPAVGPPSPSAVVASASLSTTTEGVIFVYNNLNLSEYSFNGNTAGWTFQGTSQPPVPFGIDLLSPNPTLHLVVGVQFPAPCIGSASPAPGSDVANPQLFIDPTGANPQVQLNGQPGS